jgi:hypothetical protein
MRLAFLMLWLRPKIRQGLELCVLMEPLISPFETL